MRVEIKISDEIKEPYAVIFSNAVTAEVQRAVDFLGNSGALITATENERITVLQPEEIYMVSVENEQTIIYTKSKKYRSQKRLYQLEEMLGNGFMRISKSTIVNLKQIDCVELSFKGMMKLVLKNGCQDYISRKYLPEFKKYLGL